MPMSKVAATPTAACGGRPARAAMTRAVAPTGAPDRAGHHSAAPQPTMTASTTRPRAGSVRQGPAPATIPATNGRNHQPSPAPRRVVQRGGGEVEFLGELALDDEAVDR